jgi:hypothetical protein
MRICACDCGAQTRGGVFAPGHDQRLRARLERSVGGLLALKDLLGAAEEYVKGGTDLEHLARVVHRTYVRR